MIYRNACIFTEEEEFIRGWLQTAGDVISAMGEGEAPCGEPAEDLEGALVIPGLVDTHIHGLLGADFSDGDPAGLLKMARGLLARGVTSFAPASMTLPYDVLEKAFRCAAEFAAVPRTDAARLAGIHMEGPFFFKGKKGAQNEAYLRLPDFDAFRRLYDACGGLIRIVDIAPELPGAAEFARAAAPLTTVSVAHSNASYEEAKAVFDAGAVHVSHLYNAMTAFHHQQPGIIGAASENENVTAELICDGHHVQPAAIRMAFKLFPDRIILVTDALRCAGMPDGRYTLGGQPIVLAGGAARLENGVLAGAASDLLTDLRNAIRFGIAPEKAVTAATLRPAQAVGAAERIGSLRPGKLADFLVLDEAWKLRRVYLGGRPAES